MFVALRDHATSMKNCPLGDRVVHTSLLLNEYTCQRFTLQSGGQRTTGPVCYMAVAARAKFMEYRFMEYREIELPDFKNTGDN